MRTQTHRTSSTTDATSRQALSHLIDRQLLDIAFQPIWDLRGPSIIGYEALSRPQASSGFAHVGELFEATERCGMVVAVENLARTKAFEAAAKWTDGRCLFINNSPAAYTGEGFVESIEQSVQQLANLDPSRIVLEITEHGQSDDDATLHTNTLHLRESGFRLAIDDVGAGFSGLNQIMSLRPNWIKLDRELVCDLDCDPLKQHMIRFLCKFARFGNMDVIAEGIERREELLVLIELGVTYCQGFLLGRPQFEPAEESAENIAMITQLHDDAQQRAEGDVSSANIESLASPVCQCDLEQTVTEVAEQHADAAPGAPIVLPDGRRVLGVTTRSQLRQAIENGQGHAPVTAAGRQNCLTTVSNTSIGEVLVTLSTQPDEIIAQPIVVLRAGSVLGVVPVRDLLRVAAECHVAANSHIAPLTGLPSRVKADLWINEHIRSGDPANIAFIDLRDFGSYNMSYSTELGDSMLVRVAELIRSLVKTGACEPCFTAHLGEDLFMIASPVDMRPMLEELHSQFEQSRNEFFATRDLAAGSFESSAANGASRDVVLTDLRIVYLQRPMLEASEARQLYQRARQLRMLDGPDGDRWSGIICERRCDDAAAPEHRLSA